MTYFKEYSSTNPNMMAVAYMMDINVWSPFATSTNDYAEYAIGGPSIELLFTAYNKYKGLTEENLYTSQVIGKKGYQTSKDGGINYYDNAFQQIKVNSPYSIYSLYTQVKVDGYWLASPANRDGTCLFLVGTSMVESNPTYDSRYGFRPIVLLNSNYTLEKTKDKDGNDAFKIVEQ